MAVSKPTTSDAVNKIKDLFGKQKGQQSDIAGQSGLGDAGQATNLNLGQGQGTATSVAGAVGTTAVGAGASAAAAAVPGTGAASGSASGLSGAASGLTGGSAAGTSGGTSATSTPSTSSGQASSASSTAPTSSSGATGNTNSAPTSSGSTTQGGTTPSTTSTSSGQAGSAPSGSASGNAPGGSASGGATSGNSAASGGTSAGSAPSTGSGQAGGSASTGAPSAGGTPSATSSSGGSSFASAAKNSASSAASGNVPTSASGVASAAGAGNIPTSASGVASAAQSNIPGANNIPTSASGAMGAVQSNVPGASNIPTSASGALGAATSKIPGGGSIPGGIPTSGDVLGKVGTGLGVAGLAVGGVGLAAGAVGIGATVYQLKNGLGGAQSAAQSKIAAVNGKQDEIELKTMKDSSDAKTQTTQDASTQTDNSSTATSSSSSGKDDNVFLKIDKFDAWSAGVEDIKEVTSLTFKGGMSEMFEDGILEFQAETAPKDLKTQIPNVIGTPVTIKIRKTVPWIVGADTTNRTVNYYLTVYVQNISYDTSSEGDVTLYTYKLNIVSRLWFLSLRTNCKIFQGQTTQSIIKAILEDHGFAGSDYKFNITENAALQKLDYCVQYRETDLNFILRLMAAKGIFCYWKYTSTGATLIIADNVNAYNTPPNIQELKGNSVKLIKHYYRPFSPTCDSNSHDFTDPTKNLKVPGKPAASIPESFGKTIKAEIYDPQFSYTQGQGGAGDDLNKVMVNDQAGGYELIKVEGKSGAFNLSVGDKIKFDSTAFPVEENESGEYVVVYIDRDFTQSEENCNPKFTCIPANVVFSSKLIVDVEGTDEPLANRYLVVIPKIEGPQLAKVTGKSGEGVETDEYGRVHIKFYWDQNEATDGSTSCWVRIVHSAGMQGVPNIGTDVVVQFINGDLNQPLVVGQVFSGANKPFVDYSSADNQFTHALGRMAGADSAGEYNSIVLNDKKDSQKLTVTAPKDMSCEVGSGDLTFTVGTGENQTIISVTKDGAVSITAPNDIAFKSNKGKITLDGATGVEISSSAGIKVDAGSTLDLTAKTSATLNGGAKTTVSGAMVEAG